MKLTITLELESGETVTRHYKYTGAPFKLGINEIAEDMIDSIEGAKQS